MSVKDRVRIRPITPTIGAEILDVDLARLDQDLVDELRAIFLDHQVIMFRDQKLTVPEYRDFASRFGKIVMNHNPLHRVDDYPDVTRLVADENSKNIAGESFHSDGGADEMPPMASMLYMQQVPANGGGDTIFANTQAAYDALSARTRDFIDGLTAVNDRHYGLRGLKGSLDRSNYPPATAIHPVVRVHPETGRKGIFVNRTYTESIVELPRHESDAYLKCLFDHVESPLWQCRVKWSPGAIVMWDNRCVQHYAVWDYFPHRREAYRITLTGDRPYGPGASAADSIGIDEASVPSN